MTNELPHLTKVLESKIITQLLSIHDYWQLCIEDANEEGAISIYSKFEAKHNGEHLQDVARIIGLRIVKALEMEDKLLILRLEDGTDFCISIRPDDYSDQGPEAYCIHFTNGLTAVDNGN